MRWHVLLLAKYDRLAASTRLRSFQYIPFLQSSDIGVVAQSLFSDASLKVRFRVGHYSLASVLMAYYHRVLTMFKRRRFDLVWIEKESLPWWPLWVERFLLRGVPYVLDYDDADFHYYDMHRWTWVRRFFGRRLDGLMAGAALVLTGNDYLAQRAREAGAQRVEILPTVIDLNRYPGISGRLQILSAEHPRIVWIGSPCTLHFLDILREPLARLACHTPFVLRVIGVEAFEIGGVQVEVVGWEEETEVQNISDCDVGVMPLFDGPFEMGKCGYKLIQYMGCGLPVVASSVGANLEIVQEGVTGFLASTTEEWYQALAKLMGDRADRLRMGAMGRRRVEEKYCLQRTGPMMAELLGSVLNAPKTCARI